MLVSEESFHKPEYTPQDEGGGELRDVFQVAKGMAGRERGRKNAGVPKQVPIPPNVIPKQNSLRNITNLMTGSREDMLKILHTTLSVTERSNFCHVRMLRSTIKILGDIKPFVRIYSHGM